MIINTHNLLKRNTHSPIVFNLLFWGVSFVILILLFSGRKAPEQIDYIYTGCFIITLIIPVSVNLYLLIPRYLTTESYLKFGLLFLVNLLVFSWINPLVFDLIVNTFLSDYYFISYHNQLEVFFIFFVFFVLTSLLKMGEDWVYLNKTENERLLKEKEQVQQQLYYLKGQINPHFLFNSLNVLYSLAIHKKEEIETAILQLSDILRYVIYETSANQVPIQKEIELINSFISFEKNRQIKNANINFDYRVSGNFEIYPMLLLPLVENSFKHGLKSSVQNPFVTISLVENNRILNFNITNNFKPISNKENSGIGLENVQKSLSLMYPDKHTFAISKTKDVFQISLEIRLT